VLVVERGSFTSAADEFGLSQPAIADQIRRLEESLGAELFVRVGRGVRLSEFGRRFEPAARSVLAAAEEATTVARNLNALVTGHIAFGAFGAPAHYGFSDLMSAFLRDFPGVRLTMAGRNSSTVADDVRSGALEAALVVVPVDATNLRVRPIMRDEVLYVSADPARVAKPVSIDDVVRAPLVLYETHHAAMDPTRRQLAERSQSLGIDIEPRVEVEHVETALQLVARGVGDTYVPRAVTRSPIFPADTYTTTFSPPLYDTFALITRDGSRMTEAMRELTTRVEQHMYRVAAALDR
jgi:DNA-binding transcriptional LysR family regulator